MRRIVHSWSRGSSYDYVHKEISRIELMIEDPAVSAKKRDWFRIRQNILRLFRQGAAEGSGVPPNARQRQG